MSIASEIIQQIAKLSDLRYLNVRIRDLQSPGTPALIDLKNQYLMLKDRLTLIYETDDMHNVVEPYIVQKFNDMKHPTVMPDTIGSYIFGCFTGETGVPDLSIFCTPTCAPSLRPFSTTELLCDAKIIYTEGGSKPIYLVLDNKTTKTRAFLYLPWEGTVSDYNGIPSLAVDALNSAGAETVKVFGMKPRNKYIILQEEVPVSQVTQSSRPLSVLRESIAKATTSGLTGTALVIIIIIIAILVVLMMRKKK